jgi:hypothetical protein
MDWMSTAEVRRGAEAKRQEELQASRNKAIEEKKLLHPLREFCKKAHCRQCFRCGYGPVLHDYCGDLTEYHGMGNYYYGNGRSSRIDNSCPSCGWFAITWYQWPVWDGKFLFERAEVMGGSNGDGGSEKQLTKKELARIEKQNLNCLIASLRAHAKQCGQCGYGPVLHHHCNLLNTHHGDSVNGGHINNACPECGWFATDWSMWKPWTGKMGAIKKKAPKSESEASEGTNNEVAVMSSAADRAAAVSGGAAELAVGNDATVTAAVVEPAISASDVHVNVDEAFR